MNNPIKMSADKGLMIDRIISVRLKYLKPLNSAQTDELWHV